MVLVCDTSDYITQEKHSLCTQSHREFSIVQPMEEYRHQGVLAVGHTTCLGVQVQLENLQTGKIAIEFGLSILNAFGSVPP